MPRADHRSGAPPELVRLGAALRQLREERDLKQIEVASGSGISEGRVSEIESGLTDARWTTIMRLVEGLGVSLTELADVLARQREGGD
jgi:transcriptional regulator with XRE-family HTH domain